MLFNSVAVFQAASRLVSTSLCHAPIGKATHSIPKHSLGHLGEDAMILNSILDGVEPPHPHPERLYFGA
ncbi:hypothetical protein AB6Q56_10065 [Dechloromonas sp. ARDL1]|uniref:hypothetical protein n=1 Tax=Dechloromonas sp. ARDL1 TaxID=3322121 RepID=UPI003DA748AA